jgi:hypothetical protein
MTKDEATKRIGSLEPVDAVVKAANDARRAQFPNDPFFVGRNTTWGYQRDGVDEVGTDYQSLCEAVELARSLAEDAAEAELFLSSEANNPYEPFVLRLDQPGDDLLARVRASLGLGKNERLIDPTCEPAELFLFFNEGELDVAREYLADQEEIDDPDDETVRDAIGKDEDNASLTPEQAAGYRALTARMVDELDDLHQFAFDWDAAPKLYPVSPQLFVGVLAGYAVGLWANRVWT